MWPPTRLTPLCVRLHLCSPLIFSKHVSTQLRIINPFCEWRCCCTLFICLRSTQTTAGSLMIMPPCLAACQSTGHFIDLYSSLISCIYIIYHLFPQLYRLTLITNLKNFHFADTSKYNNRKTHPLFCFNLFFLL